MTILLLFAFAALLLASIFALEEGRFPRGFATAAVAVLLLALLAGPVAVASTGASSGLSEAQIVGWIAAAVGICRLLSNLFPPTSIWFRVFHALGAGTGADAASGKVAHLALQAANPRVGQASQGTATKAVR